MIQFSIHTKDKGKLLITAPHSWRELSLEQLVKIEREDLQVLGMSKLFTIICDIDLDLVLSSKDKALHQHVRDVCSFVAHPPDWEHLDSPSHLQIGEQIYKTPTDVSKLMYGQIELLSDLNGENLLYDMPEAIAIVMQPIIDKGDFDDERVAEIKELVLKASGIDCYGFALFFSARLKPFLSSGIKNSKEYLKSKTRKPTYYTDWLKEIDLIALPA